MVSYRRLGSILLSSSALFLGACQLLSGLDDLGEAASSGSTGSGAGTPTGSGAGTPASSGAMTTGPGSGAGGAGGGGTDVDLGCDPPSCPVVLVADTTVAADLIAVNGDGYIIWAEKGTASNAGVIWKAQPDGLKPELVTTTGAVNSLAADTMKAYWLHTKEQKDVLSEILLASGVPSNDQLGSEGSATALRLFNGNLYWAAPNGGGKIMWKSEPNGPISPLLSTSVSLTHTTLVFSTAAVTDYMFWNSTDAIEKAEVPGGGGFDHLVANALGVLSLAIRFDTILGNDYIYYALDGLEMTGSIWRIPADDSVNTGELVQGGLSYPTSLAVTEDNIYWIEGADTCLMTEMQIRKRSRDPAKAKVETIARKIGCPSNLVEHEGSIYFGLGKKIYKTPM